MAHCRNILFVACALLAVGPVCGDEVSEVLVKFRPGTPQETIEQILQGCGVTECHVSPYTGVHCAAIPDNTSQQSLLDYFCGCDEVEYAEPNDLMGTPPHPFGPMRVSDNEICLPPPLVDPICLGEAFGGRLLEEVGDVGALPGGHLTDVPEPSTLGLLAAGLGVAAVVRRRRSVGRTVRDGRSEV